jgi:hypothetical protein
MASGRHAHANGEVLDFDRGRRQLDCRGIYPPTMAPITWMVMSRDISRSVQVADQPVVMAVLILDVDTGLIRGLSVAEDVRKALTQAVELALNKPAGSLPPGYPQQILAEVGLGGLVLTEFGCQPGLNLIPPVDEIIPGAEAEDIFDSFVGSIAGRRQAADPPSPALWMGLIEQIHAYAEAAPWRRWADDIDFVVNVSDGEERRQLTAVVMGNAGMQFGLALFPGKVVEAELEHGDPASPWPYDPGTLVCTLDDPDEVPAELRSRAIRYCWPESAHLVPSFFGVDEEGVCEISGGDARLLAIVTAAVLSHERRHRQPSSSSSSPTKGHVTTQGFDSARYSVLHQQRKS